jgi:hypothetical protein
MTQSTYRSFVGVAKDTANANLASSVVATGTTLTLNNIVNGAASSLTAAGSTFSAIIIDGVNTETVACTGNATGTTNGSTIACAALANPHGANAYVVFQLTASIGPTAFIPVTKIDFADDYKQLPDKGFRGSNVITYDFAQGIRVGGISLDGDIFADSFGYLLSSFFGAYDYTGTSGGNPSTYAFSPLNTGTAQPTPYLFYQYNPGNNNTRVFAKSVVSDIQIKVDPGGLLGHSTKIMSFASGVVANPGTIPPAFSSFAVIPSRVATVSIGGTVTPKTLSYELTLKRDNFGEIPTLQGIQDPYAIFAGPANADVKATLVVDDDVQLLNYINGSKPSFTLTALQGATSAVNGIKIQITKLNYNSPTKIVQDGGYVKLDIPATAIANSTDKSTAGGGLSPCLITLSTGTTTGSTLY